jgi:phosphoribosylformylglycinamidine (FGAM) synthase-like amidotransferase family enzyme
MMPHPERACSNLLGNEDGRQVFKELLGVVIKEAAFS